MRPGSALGATAPLHIRLISPAGPALSGRIDAGVRLLRDLGCRVTLGVSARGRQGFLAASDALRLADLHEAFADPEVDVVAATRGGYGTQRLLEHLDHALLARSRAVFLGFSDLTALHVVLGRHCGRPSLYGPGLAWDEERNGVASRASLAAALRGETQWSVAADPAEPMAALTRGTADGGVLVGGNLTLLASAVGTPDALRPPPRAVLLLEDVREAPYRLDRMLLQLARAGTLDDLGALVLGQFVRCHGKPGEPIAADVLGQWCDRLAVPVLGGVPVGHGREQHTVPMGTRVCFGPDAVLRPTG